MKKFETEIGTFIKTDCKDIQSQIVNEGFIFQEKHTQIDKFYDTVNGDLLQAEQKIRIREAGDKDDYFILTYKGTPISKDTAKREEVEVKIPKNQLKETEHFLEALGYSFLFQIIKQREIFLKDDIEIVFDKYPLLGTWLEIEGDETKIKELGKKLLPNAVFEFKPLSQYFKNYIQETGQTIEEMKESYKKETGYDLGKIEKLLETI